MNFLRKKLFLLLFLPLYGYAATVSLDNLPEDFVEASVVIASPGAELYTVLGHASLRMQCPAYKMDYVFSYEAEDASSHALKYLSGQLRMGVRMMPTETFVDSYKEEGRSVAEYRLNLPIEVKQHLWQILDEGVRMHDVPYDFLRHGCALSVLQWLIQATDGNIVFAPWSDEVREKSRKEIACGAMENRWHRFIFSTIVGGEAYDTESDVVGKVVVPTQLVDVLSKATAYGKPLMEKEPHFLFQTEENRTQTPFSPLVAGVLILALAVGNVFLRNKYLYGALMVAQTTAGIFLTYLLLFSDLPCTEWNWLIIPFNPIPALCWRWRDKIGMPFGIITLIWATGVALYPHQLVETAHILMGMAAGVTFFSNEKNVKFKIQNSKFKIDLRSSLLTLGNA